jgi:hypothetical protein
MAEAMCNSFLNINILKHLISMISTMNHVFMTSFIDRHDSDFTIFLFILLTRYFSNLHYIWFPLHYFSFLVYFYLIKKNVGYQSEARQTRTLHAGLYIAHLWVVKSIVQCLSLERRKKINGYFSYTSQIRAKVKKK